MTNVDITQIDTLFLYINLLDIEQHQPLDNILFGFSEVVKLLTMLYYNFYNIFFISRIALSKSFFVFQFNSLKAFLGSQ
jgi:hypothetical protein